MTDSFRSGSLRTSPDQGEYPVSQSPVFVTAHVKAVLLSFRVFGRKNELGAVGRWFHQNQDVTMIAFISSIFDFF
jgi:hypothetical protein